MANTAQARKRARQAEVRRKHNAAQRSEFRTHVKNVLKAVADNDREAAEKAYQTAVPFIDRAAGKGLIHRNRAARYKSRLTRRIRALS